MNITIKIKRMGSKKMCHLPFLIEILDDQITLKAFLSLVVRSEVTKFNQKRSPTNVLNTLLDNNAIAEQSVVGKIGFGDPMDKTLANYDKALETMLLAYEDGLFKIFIDAHEYTQLDEPININEGSEVIFIRLTFLVGGYF